MRILRQHNCKIIFLSLLIFSFVVAVYFINVYDNRREIIELSRENNILILKSLDDEQTIDHLKSRLDQKEEDMFFRGRRDIRKDFKVNCKINSDSSQCKKLLNRVYDDVKSDGVTKRFRHRRLYTNRRVRNSKDEWMTSEGRDSEETVEARVSPLKDFDQLSENQMRETEEEPLGVESTKSESKSEVKVIAKNMKPVCYQVPQDLFKNNEVFKDLEKEGFLSMSSTSQEESSNLPVTQPDTSKAALTVCVHPPTEQVLRMNTEFDSPDPYENHFSVHYKNSEDLANKEYGGFWEQRRSETTCPEGFKLCLNGNNCVLKSDWCNGKAECPDGSDESRCTCRSRIDVSRLCDGVYDCPLGEDEMGCFNCDRLSFSCNEWSKRASKSACYTIDQRCDGVDHCSNRKDEKECTLLHEKLNHHPLIEISQSKGFLHKNQKGKWYPVCGHVYNLAADACSVTDKTEESMPFIQLLPKPKEFMGKFIYEGSDGSFQFVNDCHNNSALFVTCSSLQCGIKMENPETRESEDDVDDDVFIRGKRQAHYDPFLVIGDLKEDTNHNQYVQYHHAIFAHDGEVVKYDLSNFVPPEELRSELYYQSYVPPNPEYNAYSYAQNPPLMNHNYDHRVPNNVQYQSYQSDPFQYMNMPVHQNNMPSNGFKNFQREPNYYPQNSIHPYNEYKPHRQNNDRYSNRIVPNDRFNNYNHGEKYEMTMDHNRNAKSFEKKSRTNTRSNVHFEETTARVIEIKKPKPNKNIHIDSIKKPKASERNVETKKSNKKSKDKEIERSNNQNKTKIQTDDIVGTSMRVVGGRASAPASWPWVVAINRNGHFHCGGVILSDTWVMSAAHCVTTFWKYFYEVQAGILRRFSYSPQEQSRVVLKIIPHDLYDKKSMANDMALMKVREPFAINRWVKPACLPSEKSAGTNWLWGPSPGTICTAVGWGATYEHGPDPDQLREVEVPIIARCNHKEDLAGQEICAGLSEGGRDACQGDSGGPFLCKNPKNQKQWYIAGVVSHGEGCARAGEPGVYTRVSIFRDWIHDSMAGESMPKQMPKQTCPGFQCISGVRRCLPKKQRCDIYVDCLGGEDEQNCKVSSDIVGSALLDNDTLASRYNRHLDYMFADIDETDSVHFHMMNNLTTENYMRKSHNSTDSIQEEHDFYMKKMNGEDKESKQNVLATGFHDLSLFLDKTKTINDVIPGKEPMQNASLTSADDSDSSFTAKSEKSKSDLAVPKKNSKQNESHTNNNITESKEMMDNLHKFQSNFEDMNDETENYLESSKEDVKSSSSARSSEDSTENKLTDFFENVAEKRTSKHDSDNKDDIAESHLKIHTSKDFKNELQESEEHSSTGSSKPISKKPFENENNFRSASEELLKVNSNDGSDLDTLMERAEDSSDDETSTPLDTTAAVTDPPTTEQQSTTTPSTSQTEENKSIEENSVASPTESVKPTSDETTTSEVPHTDPKEENKSIETNTESVTVNNETDQPVTTNTGSNEGKALPTESNGSDENTSETTKQEKPVTRETKKESVTLSPGKDNLTMIPPMVEEDRMLPPHVNKKELPEESTEKNKDITPQPKHQKHLPDIIPAKTHNVFKGHSVNFHCKNIYQAISMRKKCDRVADCEDISDENNCSCIDYLMNYDQAAICDGFVDCWDGSDELNCGFCPKKYFHCPISKTCIVPNKVCDLKKDCEFGEDEIDCFTLFNGKKHQFDQDTRPHLSSSGFLSVKMKGSWHPVCEPKWTEEKMETTSVNICAYLGFSGVHSFNQQELDLNHMSTLRSSIITAAGQIGQICNALRINCLVGTVNVEVSHYHKSDIFKYDMDENMKLMRMQDQSYLPWIGKIYIDGSYKCSGVLVKSSWLLVEEKCRASLKYGRVLYSEEIFMWFIDMYVFSNEEFVVAVFGSKQSLTYVVGAYEQTRRIDGEERVPFSTVTLLHLQRPVVTNRYVKILSIDKLNDNNDDTICIATGLNDKKRFISTHLIPHDADCGLKNRCFENKEWNTDCDAFPTRYLSLDPAIWSGILVCLKNGKWYPAASFSEPKGPCGFQHISSLPNLVNRKLDIEHITESDRRFPWPKPVCEGVRCYLGECIPVKQICDGVPDCMDGVDESNEQCDHKHAFCDSEPSNINCVSRCKKFEMRCETGGCFLKQNFANNFTDCSDGSDEPLIKTCASYLDLTYPEKICDGIRHCADKSDEDPKRCRCNSPNTFQCPDSDICIPYDYVCDGVVDCPRGDDEFACVGLQREDYDRHGSGIIVEQKYGIWHPKCFEKTHFTKFELESICSELGFTNGHASILQPSNHPMTRVVADNFTQTYFRQVTIAFRIGNDPLAREVPIKENIVCHPLYIECI